MDERQVKWSGEGERDKVVNSVGDRPWVRFENGVG